MNIRTTADTANAERANVDRANGQPAPKALKTVVLQPHPPQVKGNDHAEISNGGRDTLAAVEGLAERARNQGSERHEIVAAAKARFEAGTLATPDAIANAARAILDNGFLAG